MMVTDALDMPASGRFAGAEHRFPLRVYFEDTDFTGVVYHANYLRYFERGRSDMLRLVGIDQRVAHAAGEGAYAVAAMEIAYKRPALLDDALLVISRLAEIGAARVVVHQRIMRGTEELASARVVVAFVGPDGRPKRQPAGWVDKFRDLQGDN